MALLRVGSLMKFVSPSVMTGFVTGSGVYIFLSQAKYLFGFKVPRMSPNYKELHYFLSHLHSKAQPYAMGVGLPAFAVLFAFHLFKGYFKARIAHLQAQGHVRLARALRMALASVMLLTIIVTTLVTRYLMVHHNAKLEIIKAVRRRLTQTDTDQSVATHTCP
jgi:MFS superfamily sulfate permease-like transporter